MANLRIWHSYLSVFVAPSILFFALTGALQLFGLHEAHDGYHPIAFIERLGRLHKDQEFALKERHGPPAHEESKAPSPPHDEAAKGEHEDETRASTSILKWFFLVVALALALSTCLGLWIALTHIRRKRVCGLLLVIGALVPIVVLIV
jgi:hypothetical protein